MRAVRWGGGVSVKDRGRGLFDMATGRLRVGREGEASAGRTEHTCCK